MNYKNSALKLQDLVERHESVSLKEIQTVTVTHLPYMGTRENFFVLINLLIGADTDQENLVDICVVVSRLVIESGLLTNEKAVEVSIFSPQKEKVRRVVRVSVVDSAFRNFLQSQNNDVLNNQLEGIKCQWPLTT